MRILLLLALTATAAAQPPACTVLAPAAPRGLESIGSTFIRDFDDDGHLDFLTNNDDRGSISYGRGDGTFARPLALPMFGRNMSVGDLTGDGRFDLIDFGTQVGPVRLSTNDGRGFGNPVALFTPSRYYTPHRVADFTSDGRPDILATSEARVYLLVQRGYGTFEERDLISGYPSAVGDLDHDGKLDLVIWSAGIYRLWSGDGQGNFTDTAALGAQYAYSYLSIADLDGDGRDDVVATDRRTKVFYEYGPIRNATTLRSFDAPSPTSVTAGDYNGDRATDLAVSIFSERLQRRVIAIYLNDGKGGFSTRDDLQLPGEYLGPSADLNDDGNVDLLFLASFGTVHVGVLLGRGDGTFSMPARAMPAGTELLGVLDDELIAGAGTRVQIGWDTFAELPGSIDVAALQEGGLEGDVPITAADVHSSSGREVIVASGTAARIYSRPAAGLWSEVGSFDAGARIYGLAAANMNESDAADEVALVVHREYRCAMQVRSGAGTLLFHSDELQCNVAGWTGSGRTGVHTADFDADGHVDVLFTLSGGFAYAGSPYHGYFPMLDGKILFFRGRGDGSFESPRTIVSGLHITDVSTGDLNGDRWPDLVLTAYHGEGNWWNVRNISVHYAQRDGTFRTSFLAKYLDENTGHAIADLNRDGIADVAVQTLGGLTYYLGTSAGLIKSNETYVAQGTPYIVRHRTGSPSVVYEAAKGIAALIENTVSGGCTPARRRSSRH